MSTATNNPPSVNSLREAIRFVFDDLEWNILFHRGSQAEVHVHGTLEFEQYRSGESHSDRAGRARSAVVQTIVAVVRRTPAASVLFSVGGPKGVDRNARAWPQATQRFRKRLRKAISEAVANGGYASLVDLWDRPAMIQYATEETEPRNSASTPKLPDGLNEIDEMLRGIKPSPAAAAAIRALHGRSPLPAPPNLPRASTSSLSKAVKYLFTTLRLEVTVVDHSPLRLSISGGARAKMFLRGSVIGSEADRARSAVGLAVRHLVTTTDSHAFDHLAPPTLGNTPHRIETYRSEVQRLVAAAIDDGGTEGLLDLCRSGLA